MHWRDPPHALLPEAPTCPPAVQVAAALGWCVPLALFLSRPSPPSSSNPPIPAALVAVIKFLLQNEHTLLERGCDIFTLSAQAVCVMNLFITFGDTFLPDPSSYDELYYEIIREHGTFDSLFECGLLAVASHDLFPTPPQPPPPPTPLLHPPQPNAICAGRVRCSRRQAAWPATL